MHFCTQKDILKKYFKGKLVPLGELQKLVRGKKELPLWGLPETICQMYTKPHTNGKLKGDLGESFIMLVQYDKNGPTIETINCYGSSNHAQSPHLQRSNGNVCEPAIQTHDVK